jgi:LmbE family N-acetylglucosaminyl deacetylase
VNQVPSLLAVIAHPGDEVFNFGATLAHYASSGAFVNIACATRGEGGRAQGTELGAKREVELRRSCAALGVAEPIFLGFCDSGS